MPKVQLNYNPFELFTAADHTINDTCYYFIKVQIIKFKLALEIILLLMDCYMMHFIGSILLLQLWLQ